MTTLRIGYCGLCTNRIWDELLDRNGRVVGRKPNKLYAEVSAMLSNGTLAKFAVCTECFPKVTDQDVATLLEQCQAYWRGEMVGWADKKEFKRVDELSVKTWDHDEKGSITKYEKIKKDEHTAKLEAAKEIPVDEAPLEVEATGEPIKEKDKPTKEGK